MMERVYSRGKHMGRERKPGECKRTSGGIQKGIWRKN